MDGFLIILTDITTYVTISILIAMLVHAFLKRSWARGRNALMFLSAFLLAAILSNTLKYIIGRERPFVTHPTIEQLSGGGSPSFPSGHTTEAFAVATILVLLYPHKSYLLIAFLWALLVGYTRIALGVHYPSDILGAAVLGFTTSLLVKAIWNAIPPPGRNELNA